MSAVHLCHVIRSFVVLFYVIKLQKAKKVRRMLNFAFMGSVTLFEVIWLIFGNTFHFSRESLKCMDRENIKPLWILMMIELIIGYILYLSCGLIVGGLSLYFWYQGFQTR